MEISSQDTAINPISLTSIKDMNQIIRTKEHEENRKKKYQRLLKKYKAIDLYNKKKKSSMQEAINAQIQERESNLRRMNAKRR